MKGEPRVTDKLPTKIIAEYSDNTFPYTPHGMRDLLQDGVILEAADVPAVEHKGLRRLAEEMVNFPFYSPRHSDRDFAKLAVNEKAQSELRFLRVRELRSAIETIDRLIPEFQASIDSTLPDAPVYTPKARAGDLDALSNLQQAINRIRERYWFSIDENNDLEVEWKVFAHRLLEAFRAALPENSNATGHRFVAKMSGVITGHTPTQKAVSDFFAKKSQPGKRKRRPLSNK